MLEGGQPRRRLGSTARSRSYSSHGCTNDRASILIESVGHAGLMIGGDGASFSGAGQITLGANPGNGITAGTAGATLRNGGNTISGAGTIGGAGLILINRPGA